MALQSQAVANLIQGVSQQAPQQRRDSQAEEQFDCVNSPVEGCIPRPHFDLTKMLPGEDFAGCYAYDIFRDFNEHYLVVVKSGSLRVFDLADGTECTVTAPDGFGYLATSSVPSETFCAATVEDYTFVANRDVIPQLGSETAPERPKEALIYFKAGAYSTTYRLYVGFGGAFYIYTYTTPDNSVSGNAAYIATNQLTNAMYGAMAGLDALGFTRSLHGSSIKLARTDGADFTVEAQDGVGQTHFKAAKDTIQVFSDLPKGGVDKFTIKVRGDSKTGDDDYYVAFSGISESGGYWEETVKPGSKIKLDAATMPYQLINTGYRTFTFQKAQWGQRVAGDTTSAPDPSFVGKRIQDLFFDRNRLAILTEGTCVWSKLNNPYVFWADTVQTVLDTAPVDIKIRGGRTRGSAPLRRAVQAGEATMLWAQKAQYRITSGSDPFKQDTVEAPPSTSYEFAEGALPLSVGTSLYFVTEPGAYARLRDLFIREGKPLDDTDVTAHVGKYIPSGVRYLSASDALGLLMVWSEATPSRLYAYNWLVSDNQRVQSAWQTWRLPPQTQILWTTCFRSFVYALVQRPDGAAFLRLDLSQDLTDPGGSYLTRLDMRVSSAGGIGVVTYDATTDTSSVPLPYQPYELDADPTRVLVAVAQSGANSQRAYVRGQSLPVLGRSGATLKVRGDVRGIQLYVGHRISAEREESEFYLRSEAGARPVDHLQVAEVVYVHAKSAYYRAEVTYTDGRVASYEFAGRYLGDPSNVTDTVVIANGELRVPIACEHRGFKLRLINDSFLPSAWQTSEWRYTAALRAVPNRQG